MKKYNLTERHREHFYMRENPDRAKEIRGRERSTTLRRMITHMHEGLEAIEDESKREKVRRLVDEITASTIGYIDARIGHMLMAEKNMMSAIEEADRARRSAHIRLVDAIRITSRNLVKEAEGWHLDEDMAELVGDGENPDVRDRVAQAAIDLVWELLEEEDRQAV